MLAVVVSRNVNCRRERARRIAAAASGFTIGGSYRVVNAGQGGFVVLEPFQTHRLLCSTAPDPQLQEWGDRPELATVAKLNRCRKEWAHRPIGQYFQADRRRDDRQSGAMQARVFDPGVTDEWNVAAAKARQRHRRQKENFFYLCHVRPSIK